MGKNSLKKRTVILFIVASLTCSGCGKQYRIDQIFGEKETVNVPEPTNNVLLKPTEKALDQRIKESDIEETTDEEKTEKETELYEDKTEKEDSIVFDTEYTIEEYYHGVFIVSKSDGLLYGALNVNGEEILPVKYDEVSFMNDEDVTENNSIEPYLQARYEDKYSIFDSKGQKIIEGVAQCKYVRPMLGESGGLEAPCFCEYGNASIKLYTKNGEFICEFSKENIVFEGLTCINSEYFLLTCSYLDNSNVWNIVTMLVNRETEAAKVWNGTPTETMAQGDAVLFWIGEGEEFCEYSVDSNGNFEETQRISQEEYLAMKQGETLERINNKDTHQLGMGNTLYSSNGTWKLVDAQGNPLYDERYFNCTREGDCFFLQNEDQEVCVINSNGKKIVDYGKIQGYAYSSIYEDRREYSFMGTEIKSETYFSDPYSVCFAIKNNKGTTSVYFFGEKEQ